MRSFIPKGLVFCLFVLATISGACTDAPEIIQVPSPVPVRVALPASLEPMRSALAACAKNLPDLALLVERRPAASLDFDEVDLALWLGEKPDRGEFAAPVVQEQIALIANPHNPLKTIALPALTGILSGEINNWKQINLPFDHEISLWIYPPENEIRNALEAMLGKDIKVLVSANLAADPETILKAVEGDRTALGFLPAAWLTSGVKTVEIEDIEIILPVLALSAREPQGMPRHFLACLQGPIGQAALENYHQSVNPGE